MYLEKKRSKNRKKSDLLKTERAEKDDDAMKYNAGDAMKEEHHE